MQTGRHAPLAPERLTPATSGAPPRPTPHQPDPDSLRPYLEAAAKHRRLLVLLPLAFGVVAFALSFTRSRTYEASAAFVASEPSSMSGSLGALSSVASQLGIPALSAVASGSAALSTQFYGDLLTSNALLHAAVMTRYVAAGTDDQKPFTGTLVEYFDPRGKTQTDRELAAMHMLSRVMLTVAVDRPTGIVRIAVRTKNRSLSALVARRLLDLINEFNLKRRQSQAGAEKAFAAQRTRAALDTLRAAETALAGFRATNIDFSRSPRLATREAELQRGVALAQQLYTTVAQRYEIANIEAVRNTPIVTVIDAPEGLVEARPRNTVVITAVAWLVGLALASGLVLASERSSFPR